MTVLAGVAAALVLVTDVLFLWNARADRASPISEAPQAVAASDDTELLPPPEASEKTCEEERFARCEQDRNGAFANILLASVNA